MKVDAKQLAELRKQTGYSLSLCRDALLENNNDIKVAQEWLDEEAIKKGWQKAEKLQGRKTSEGLIGVMVENNHAAMVEVYVREYTYEGRFFRYNSLNCLHHKQNFFVNLVSILSLYEDVFFFCFSTLNNYASGLLM